MGQFIYIQIIISKTDKRKNDNIDYDTTCTGKYIGGRRQLT